MPTNPPKSLDRFKLPILALITVAVLVALAVWAGMPKGQTTAFFAGVAILICILLLFGLTTWYLLIKPLPAGAEVPRTTIFSFEQRRLMAVLLGIGGLCLTVGGFWDELWHRRYGLPFGPDLLWRPHLLIYASLLIPSALALLCFVQLIVKGQGTLQQRFRTDRTIGALILVGALLVLMVPADPIWHTIYGHDISAWSLPHILLLFNVSTYTILAAAIQLSTIAPRSWSSIAGITAAELLPVIAYAFALNIELQLLTLDWESTNRQALLRPDWLLPAIFVALAAFVGSLANHSLRRSGVATMVGILTLTMRFTLLRIFDLQETSLNSWLPILPPLVALDAWYAFRVKIGKPPASAIANGIAVMIGLLGSVFIINRVFAYPHIGLSDIPPVILAGVLAGAGASWIGQTLGNYLATENKHLEATARVSPWLRLVPPVLLAGTLAFVIFFIATATPPE